MHPKLNWIDWVIAATYLAVVIGVALRFLRKKDTGTSFFLGDRSFGWLPVGFSLTATSISTLTFVSIPAAGIRYGWYCLWWLAPLMVVVPFALLKGLPWLRSKGASTVYELLESHFGPEVRFACCILFLIWRLLWTATIIYTAGRVILLIVGGPFPEWSTILLLSLVTTLYTYLGGMKAVVWTDVVQTVVMFAGVACILWLVMAEKGPASVSEIPTIETGAGSIEFSQLLIAVIESSVALLSLYLADQITAQRFLAARSLTDSRAGLILHTVLSMVLLTGLGAAGVLLNGSELQRPGVVESEMAGPLGRPSRMDPATRRASFLGLEHRGMQISAAEQELPTFISHRLTPGFTAVIGLALVAAAMSTFDSAVNSLGAVLHFDFDRRFGWGFNRQSVAVVQGIADSRELRLAKPLTWFLGVAAGLLSLLLPNLERLGIFPVIGALSGVTAPMLGLVLVAILGVRSSAKMACLGLAAGLSTTCGLILLRDLRPDLVESGVWLSYLFQLPFICGVIVSATFAWVGRESTIERC